MRIKCIELAWFRGATDPVLLEPNCKSMVVYGDNGSGKSSFVDAVEYVLNKGSINHLKHEYSSSYQANGIPNTHKPESKETALKITFKDDSELHIDFMTNGASKKTSAKQISMDEWEYRQTVLRQDEVSAFIHNTKGEKYSALLPLLGLQNMEFAAENLRQLAKTVRSEAKLSDKQTKLVQIGVLRKESFGMLGDEEIVKCIDDLFSQYCKGTPNTSDAVSRCHEVDIALENVLKGYSAENQRHFFLRQLAESDLKERVDSVRASSVDLAKSTESSIVEKLEVLQSARKFGDTLDGVQEVDCPACGQAVSVDTFREHVKMESERLRELYDIFIYYKAAIGTVCSSLDSLKSNLSRTELKTWRDGQQDAVVVDGFKYLDELSFDALRETCSDESLKAIEGKLLPIIATAELDSKSAPTDVQKLTDDKKRASAAKAVIACKELKSDIENSEKLIAFLDSIEQEVRSEIRWQSQLVIENISKDIESMWATLHPGEKIDNIRLSVPQSVDKAIDVVLNFHGKDQDSPRLTLSEGYRNSLGLCIFLAMAKQVSGKERPLFWDDVVISLDRNHRGMIQELLEKEFIDRQVIIFTHDREWYTELRYQLDNDNRWLFKTLLPYQSPDMGIRWSHSTSSFDEARELLAQRPDSAVNDARKIMDVELPMIAERLQIQLPYLRSDKNDKRTAYDFLTHLVADEKKCFQRKSGSGYVAYTDAIDAWAEAIKLILSWGNRGSHTFDVVKSEATKVIDACEAALGCFKCDSCSRNVWMLHNGQSSWVQCSCGELRWRYGKA